MAIAPNVTFVSGAILTAAQQNAFGFGIVATATSSAVTLTGTVEAVSITASTFKAIANMYYKITYTCVSCIIYCNTCSSSYIVSI